MTAAILLSIFIVIIGCVSKVGSERKEERSFRADWCLRYPWLHYNLAFCHVCVERKLIEQYQMRPSISLNLFASEFVSVTSTKPYISSVQLVFDATEIRIQAVEVDPSTPFFSLYQHPACMHACICILFKITMQLYNVTDKSCTG